MGEEIPVQILAPTPALQSTSLFQVSVSVPVRGGPGPFPGTEEAGSVLQAGTGAEAKRPLPSAAGQCFLQGLPRLEELLSGAGPQGSWAGPGGLSGGL